MKRIKKVVSSILVGAVTFNYFSPVAVALTLTDGKVEKTLPISNTTKLEDNGIVPKGNIEVETHLLLPIRNTGTSDISLTIYDASGNHASVGLKDVLASIDGYLDTNITLGEQNIRVTAKKRDEKGNLLSGIDHNANVVYFAVNLYELIRGTYKIELSGTNFVTYSKDVTLDDYSKRLSITNEKGLFEIGDVTKDNVVNEEDITAMLKAMEESDISKDLNLDGSVDIADLNYITAIMKGNKKEAKLENTDVILSNDNVSLEVSSATLAEGSSSLDTIFSDDGVVSLEQNGEDPIEVALDLSGKEKDSHIDMSVVRINFGANVPEDAKIVIETEDGKLIEHEIPKESIAESTNEIHLFTDEITEGTREIKLGNQYAVKKVTIVINKAGANNLADIAKVEFLNNVKYEAKEPENFYTPKYVEIDDSKSEQVTVSFESVPNVTGYEIKINGNKMNNVIFQTTYTNFTIEDLKNYNKYEIQVRSVNQDWRSGWSKVYTAEPKATRVPPKVDMVVATPTYSGIDFSWKAMDDTKSYNLYYREVGETEWQVIERIDGTSKSLRGLKAQTKYEAYLTGNNDLGEGDKSQTVSATTLEQTATIYPKYKLINGYNDTLQRTDHINDVIFKDGKTYIKDKDNNVTDSDKWALVDDDYTSYWEFQGWQVNAHYESMNAPMIVLDDTYLMDEFVITVPDSYQFNYKSTNNNDAVIRYWNTDGEKTSSNRVTVQAKITVKEDENKRKYYVLKLDEPIEANALQFGLTVAGNGSLIQVSEFKLYEYDSLVDDVAALFKDDLRVELVDGVTKDEIEELRKRADIKSNGEYNPYRESILNDLDYAEKILNDEKLNDVIVLNPNISNSYNSHLGFAMTINDYQPLGISVKEGDQLTVYVGTKGNVNVELLFTQNYSEANAWSKSVSLKKGQNIINVPKIGSATSERGGSVYIRYTSKPDQNNLIKVRVSGGVKIPMLDTTLLTSDTEKKEAIKEYITTLKEYVTNLPTLYSEIYKDSENPYSYDKTTGVFGVTEIVTRHGLWSFSAEAVLDALETGTNNMDEMVDRLFESTEAFNEMMEMFYRHKGLEENASVSTNEIPKARINIRYMRMFDGAFMYAGGYHIGIEYGSIAGVIQGRRNTDAKTGYFGWGISHEVGHQINQGNIVFAEVTNNVYSLLAQTANDKDVSRLENSQIYEKIYDKVTSHTLGRNQNVFVTLGMYWQLHLAYDDNKTFDDINSVFSRINIESRTYKNTKNYSKDDLLILFASIATGKDLTDYFEVWGIKATDELKEEIASKNLPKEDKAIYYLNDEARRYRLNNGTKISNDTKVSASIISKDDSEKRIALTFDVNKESDKILGYEIIRNGEVIAFVDGSIHEFVDNIGSVNNRAFTYEVVAYDKLLNKTNKVTLDEVKVAHDGSIKKDTFSIESNFKVDGEIVDFEDDNLDYKTLGVNKLIDGDNATWFNGNERIKTLVSSNNKVDTTTDNNDAYVIISLNTKMSLSGIKYRAYSKDGELDIDTISKYRISVSSDKEHWTVAREGTFDLNSENEFTNTVYFMNENTTSQTQLWTYHDVSYIKIESVGNKSGISGAELDLIAPPGDNVDFATNNGKPSIGKLETSYCYLKDGCNENNRDEDGNIIGLIEAGSVIFEGIYAGNPSFNIVTINNASNDEEKYSGYQVIFAEVNDDLTVYEVSKGTWIYVMSKEQYEEMLKETNKIRAVLYRVSDALTLDGERITSSSMAVNLDTYENLESVNITEQR